MDESTPKTRSKINMCTYRRLNIEHKISEHLCKQNCSSNLHFYKHREQLFNRKMNHLKEALEHIEPNANEEESLITSNHSTRIQNHFRLMNFSSQTEKRLSCQLPYIPQKRNSNEIDPSIRRASFNSRKSDFYRSPINHRYSPGEHKTFQSYLNQQIFDEKQKQLKNDERKDSLLKEFDELKHTIKDPHSTISVLAALSRAIIFLDSATE